MSDTPWTKGPWQIAGPSGFAILSDTSKGRFLVGVAHHGANRRLLDTREILQDVAHANACLIATAPELYEALKQFTGAWLPNQKAWAISEMYEARDKALKAMAKARGEQQ